MASYQSEPLAAEVPAGHADKARRFDSLRGWLEWQESLHLREIDLGLERTRSVARSMGLKTPAYSVVTVAGTNGKGSSVAMLEAIWRRAGYRVATYTSPHLLRYNERIRVDGAAVDDERICRMFERIEDARRNEMLTYFEYGTLAAFAVFEEAEPDIAVLEIGLGGRLDAVNTVDPDVALIAALGIDHVEWLGSTRAAIAREKAGIMRAGRPVVCSDPAVPAELVRVANELGARLDLMGPSYRFEEAGGRWTWWSRDGIIEDLPMPNLPGRYQLRNAAGALRVIELLQDRHPVEHAHIREALCSIELHGRFQRIPGEVEHILDVAHNEQAIGAFVETLQALPAAARTHVLLGMLKTKDHASAIRALSPIADTWRLASLPLAKGATSGELEAALKREVANAEYTCHDRVEQAYEAMLAGSAPGDRVIVIGSFVTVGAVLKQLLAARETVSAEVLAVPACR